MSNSNTGKDIEIEDEFGKYQTKLFRNQAKANFSAKALEFVPFMQNFNKTATGSIYGLKLLNTLFPFTDTKNDMAVPHILLFLLDSTIKWIKTFSNNHKKDPIAAKIAKLAMKITPLFGYLDISILTRLQNNLKYNFKAQMLMNKKFKTSSKFDGVTKGDPIELFKNINDLKILIAEWASEWDPNLKKEFFDFFIKSVNSLTSIASKVPKDGIVELIQKGADTLASFSPDDVISFMGILGDMMGIFAKHEDKFIAIENNSSYQDKDFNGLTKEQQKDIAIQLGYKGNDEFEDDSVLDGLYKIINNKTFSKMFLDQEGPLYKFNSENSREIHEDLMQYALDDKNWTIDEKSFKMDGAISGNNSLNKKFSYSIEYKGIGDKTVTKFLNEAVTLPDNFNPIEPWHTPTNISKGWSAQDYKDYTGLGNKELYDNVHFKYNVEWSNVSDKTDFPYWVITKIDLFRQENGQWKQFYPVM